MDTVMEGVGVRSWHYGALLFQQGEYPENFNLMHGLAVVDKFCYRACLLNFITKQNMPFFLVRHARVPLGICQSNSYSGTISKDPVFWKGFILWGLDRSC
jgi:hypothetical protein